MSLLAPLIYASSMLITGIREYVDEKLSTSLVIRCQPDHLCQEKPKADPRYFPMYNKL